MPTFEFTCSRCGKEFERVVFSGQEKGIFCPECKGTNLVKNMSASSFMGTSLGKLAINAPKEFS